MLLIINTLINHLALERGGFGVVLANPFASLSLLREGPAFPDLATEDPPSVAGDSLREEVHCSVHRGQATRG